MRKLFFLTLLTTHFAFGQETNLRLDSCVAWAKANYPLLKQSNLVNANSEANLLTIRENWYPKLTFLAKGTYQSEVVSFNIPGINTNFPHDSYLTNVSLDQTVFDGGQTKMQKQIEQINAGLEVQKNEVELYKLVERINQIYVNILLGRENLNVLNTYKNDIDNRRKKLAAGQENGLVLQSTLDELDAESLKTEQSIIEGKENLESMYRVLAFYIAKPVNENSVLTMSPLGGTTDSDAILRPEMKMFSLQESLLESRYQLTNKYALPNISVFAGMNYGRPGPNFINQNLRFFGDAGLTIKWNISSLYGLSREKLKFSLSQEMVAVQREVFLFNLNTNLTNQKAQIVSLQEIITKDKQIIEKRHNVTQTASAQLENGKITVTEYLTQLNAELQATLNQKIHEIRLMNATSTYNTTRGITNF